MTSLRLRAISHDEGIAPVDITVGSPASGVAILDLKVDSQQTEVPLHWRAGDWVKPPLDVALTRAGQIQGIQVVLQDEAVEMSATSRAQDEFGIPSFEVDDWPADRYSDFRVKVKLRRMLSGEFIATIGSSIVTRYISVDNKLKLGLDFDDYLVSIIVGPLAADQWHVLETAATK
jgi:hypothetical protein